MFNNSGNIGVSLITLVFMSPPFAPPGAESPLLKTALAVQIMTLIVQNLTTNTIGFIKSGGEGMTLKSGILRVLKMPMIYTVTCAIFFRFIPFDFKLIPGYPALDFLKNGMVAVALVTLGVQLSKTKLDFKMKTPYIAALGRLIGGPVAAFLLIKLFGFTGVTAQSIFIASSTPTAVNTALLAIECRGDVNFAAHTVAVSTLLSAVTMTASVYLAYVIF